MPSVVTGCQKSGSFFVKKKCAGKFDIHACTNFIHEHVPPTITVLQIREWPGKNVIS